MTAWIRLVVVSACLVALAPGALGQGVPPPRVSITGVYSDRVAVSYEDGVELAVGRRNLEVRYAADTSDPVRYEFRMEGLEDEWAAVGRRSVAYYRGLDTGDYTFLVRASEDGVAWSAPAAVAVTIEGSLYEQLWVQLLLALGVLGGVAAVGRWQAGRLRRESQRLETLVASRTRALSDENDRAEAALRDAEAAREVVEEQALQLLRLDHVKNRLFTNVSHEIRTPLTLVLHPLRRAAGRDDLDDDLRASLATAHDNAQRLLHLVNQILDLAKLEAGGASLRLATVDVVAAARQVASAFAHEADRVGVEVQIHAAVPALGAHADRAGLDKVLFNLLSNALKATDPGGRVRLDIRPEGADAYEIAVSDTGTGIAAEDLPSVFDRFYQVETGRTRGGTGIGLALTREIAELHGGTISVESEVGVGSTFTVRLPVRPETLGGLGEALEPGDEGGAVSLERQAATAPAHANDARPLVLVAEDHPELRALLRDVLGAHWRVAEAADGAAALALARAERPALVVSDVLMPTMDGLELCAALRADAALADLPVVLVTARASEEAVLEALWAGADDVLTKPFSEDELVARARNLIEGRSALRRQYSGEVVVPSTGRAVTSADGAFLERLYAAIDERIDDAGLSVGELARTVGVSESTLKRRVGRITGVPPVEFVRDRRLERGAELLRGRAGTVSEVAAQVGFESPSYFARCFRERFGMAPSAFADLPASTDAGRATPQTRPADGNGTQGAAGVAAGPSAEGEPAA